MGSLVHWIYGGGLFPHLRYQDKLMDDSSQENENRELKTKGLPNQAARLQEQREWMQSYEQLRAWEEIVMSSDDEEALLRQITVSNSSGPSTSKGEFGM